MKKSKQDTHYAFEDLKILQAEQRFKAKRDEQLLKKLDEEKEKLEYWFANTYPDISLKIHLVLSRKMNELEVAKKLKFYSSNRTVSLESTVDSNTWYRPDKMEKYVDNFVENHKASIIDMVERMNKGI